MENWSLGVDGPSVSERDTDARPASASILPRLLQSARDLACRPSRRPRVMLESWSSVFEESVKRFRPQPGDRIVVNTGGDFQLLALARAIEQLDRTGLVAPLTIHVIFHFAVFESIVTDRAVAYGRQVNLALKRMKRHNLRLHATTDSLTNQLNTVGVDATSVPYPTRQREQVRWATAPSSPTKILLAGMPRAEKGRNQIHALLESIENRHLRSGKFVWSMQLPKKRWRRMIPSTLHDQCDPATSLPQAAEMEIMHGNLASEAYHAWLDTAGVGLFLYDPVRYVARCSGVLLEMMIRGIPVIVPNQCWLADQVRSASVSGAVGWIYDSVSEIPGLLDQLHDSRAKIVANCQRHAVQVAEHHAGKTTLMEMGIANVHQPSARQAG